MTPLTMGKSLFILLSLPTSVVLTMDQSCYTTLVEQNTSCELSLSGFGLSGVHPIVFGKFYDDAFNYTRGEGGRRLADRCAALVTAWAPAGLRGDGAEPGALC